MEQIAQQFSINVQEIDESKQPDVWWLPVEQEGTHQLNVLPEKNYKET